MHKCRFGEAQMVGIIKESDAGANAKERCRKYGVSTNTLYTWKVKFGGMDVSDVAKMRVIEDENRRLKRVVANQSPEIDALKIVSEGNF